MLQYDGVMSAEHGDGLARSEWQEKMFGPRIYQAFREVKAAFDPQGIMNPGKIVDAPPMDRHLRYGDGYRTVEVATHFDFSRDGGFARSVELCSGVGACRKKLDGTMCPSYLATLEEAHCTRGRANMLRAAISGELAATGGGPSRSDWVDPRVLEVLDLCLECKACKSECPSNVDVAKLKSEFLAHYYARHGTPLRARFFGRIAAFSRVASVAAPLANRMQEHPLFRDLLERLLGIDRRRPLPRLATETLHAWVRRRRPDLRAGRRGEVVFLAATFTNYNEPEIGKAAIRLLEAFGYRVHVPRLECCGRPMISKGLLHAARDVAERNVQRLEAWCARGVPVVGVEPSCVVTLKDEYRELGLGAAAERVAEGVWLLEEFLAARVAEGAIPPGELPFRECPREVRFHGHCHQKAVLGTRGTLAALRLVPGYRVSEYPSGCCGMAGSFGYEKEHYDLSLAIGELSLLPLVRETPGDALIVASGTSCRQQIEHATGRRAVHPAQALAEALR